MSPSYARGSGSASGGPPRLGLGTPQLGPALKGLSVEAVRIVRFARSDARTGVTRAGRSPARRPPPQRRSPSICKRPSSSGARRTRRGKSALAAQSARSAPQSRDQRRTRRSRHRGPRLCSSAQAGQLACPSASFSASCSRASIRSRPRFQKLGSLRSKPIMSPSVCGSRDPPAASISRYWLTNGLPISW
jgi:hypothetical protein